MRVWSSKIVALLLAWTLMPGAFEVVESTAHLVTEGHLPHASHAADQHEPSGPEHGCTSVFHLCSCHASLSFIGQQRASSATLSGSRFTSAGVPPPLSPGFWPSVDRPPQA